MVVEHDRVREQLENLLRDPRIAESESIAARLQDFFRGNQD